MSMLPCWMSWFGAMMANDPQQRYHLHVAMAPPPLGGATGEHGHLGAKGFTDKGVEGYRDRAWLEGVLGCPSVMYDLLHARRDDGRRVVGACDAAIFTDLDVLPLRPFSTLLTLPPVDLRLFHEPLRTWHSFQGAVNSGFYLVRNRPATRLLLRKWLHYLREMPNNWKKYKNMFSVGNQLLLNRALYSPEVQAAGLTWGGFAVRRADGGGRGAAPGSDPRLTPWTKGDRISGGLDYLVGRAGATRKSYRLLTNLTVAFHACCAPRKWDNLALAARCHARWPLACLPARDDAACARLSAETPASSVFRVAAG